ncbi:hypothetical protein FY557_12960 [Chryseobacterium sp. SN22]|uniref:bacteriocin-like protein n=1 Tax=Chryseobacterium sp. SN22 TaxID=2606431 RepID=UPI0011EFF60B|nr:hypothetical protein [Chryseobacterium sp. SN22]KAA0127522.1 hypothetical protein FY557_12960 [Chryseobacterium sp. SN22]
MKNFRKLSREDKKSISAGAPPAFCFEGDGPGTGGCGAGEICSGGKCVPYSPDPGGGGPGNPGGGITYTCICPWGTVVQTTPCPEFYCITG